MTPLQVAFNAAIVTELALIVFVLLAILLELPPKPAATKAAPPIEESLLHFRDGLFLEPGQCCHGGPAPPPAPVVRLKTGSWVRVGTPAHEQAVRSGMVEK